MRWILIAEKKQAKKITCMKHVLFKLLEESRA